MTKGLIMNSDRYPIVAARSTESVFNLCLLNFPEQTCLEFSTRLQNGYKNFNNYVDDCLSPPTSTSTSPSSSDLISMLSELSDSRGSSSFNGFLASDTEHSTSENSASPVFHTTDILAPSTTTTSANLQRSISTGESYAENPRSNIVSLVSESFPISTASNDPDHFPPDVTAAHAAGYEATFVPPTHQDYDSVSQYVLSPCASAHTQSPRPVTTTYHTRLPTIPLHTHFPSSQLPSTHICTTDLDHHSYGQERTVRLRDNALHRGSQTTTSSYRPLRPSVFIPHSDSSAAFRYTVPSSTLPFYPSCTGPRLHQVHDLPTTSVTARTGQRYLAQVSTLPHCPSRRLFEDPVGGRTLCHPSGSTASYSREYGNLDSQIPSASVECMTTMRSACDIQNPFHTNSKRHIENPYVSVSHTLTKRRCSMGEKERAASAHISSGAGDLLLRPLSLRDSKNLLHNTMITKPNEISPPLPKPLKQCFPMATITTTCLDHWKVDVNGRAISSNRKYTSFPYYLRYPAATTPKDSEVLFTLTGLFNEVINTPDILHNNILISTRQRLSSHHGQVSNYCCPASPRSTRDSGDGLLSTIFNIPTNERSTTPPLAVLHQPSVLKLPVRSAVCSSTSQSNSANRPELIIYPEIDHRFDCVTCSQCEMQIMSADGILHFRPNGNSENRFTFCSLGCLVNHQSPLNNEMPSCALSTVSSTSAGVRIATSLVSDPNCSTPVLLHSLTSTRVRKEMTRRRLGRRRQSIDPSIRNRDAITCLEIRKRWGKTGWCRAGRQPARSPNPVRSFKKPSPPGAPEPSWHLLALTLSNADTRICGLCHHTGDGSNSVSGRLLNYDTDTWFHLNCILWCYDVYETVSGGLEKVFLSVQKANNTFCSHCGLTGAGLQCYNADCSIIYHLPCAHRLGCVFRSDRSMYCPLHREENSESKAMETLAVKRRVFISRDESTQVGKVIVENAHHSDSDQMNLSCMPGKLRVGSLILHSIGQLLPEQLISEGFHNENFIYPVGYASTRIYWSYRRVGHRCLYHCRIEEGLSDISPTEGSQSGSCSTTYCAKFVVTVEDPLFPPDHFSDKSCNGVWQQILTRINESRHRPKQKLMRICKQHVRGETLFGLTEPHIIRAIESLPGVDRIEKYVSKFDRRNLIKGMPLAINPTGCARAEPKLRTHVRNRRPIGDSVNSMSARLTTKCRNGPLSRSSSFTSPLPMSPASQSTVSKSQQYRHLLAEWRQNVLLARSRIQGLGLYASRRISRNAFIIEYLGEVIRNEVGNRRERLYQLQNRGIYMFRVDNDLIVDATMCGGLARYINHSCEPNCTAETLLAVENGRQNSSIIIVARRDIETGEELTYDYKLDVEEDILDRIPCVKMPELSAAKSSARRFSPPRKSYESSNRSSRPSWKPSTGGSNSRTTDNRRPVRRCSSSRSPPKRRRRRSSSTSSDSSATSDSSSSSSSSSADSRNSPKHKESGKRQSKTDLKTTASRPRPPPPRSTGTSAKPQADVNASKQTDTTNSAGGSSKTSGARDSRRTATNQVEGKSSSKPNAVEGSRPTVDRQQPSLSASNGSCEPAEKVTTGVATRDSQQTVKVTEPRDRSPLESSKKAVNKPETNIPRDDEGELKKSNANLSTALHPSSAPNLDIPKGSRQIIVEKLTKNVTKVHITEIFSVWGTIQSVDMPADRLHPEFSRSYAYVTYEDAKSAADAVHYMSGGQIDGETVRVTEVAMREPVTAGARHPLPGDTVDQRRPLQRDELANRRDGKRVFNDDDRNRRRRREGSASPRHRVAERRRPDADPYHQRERDRRHVDMRRARRGSSGSPFASRTATERRRSSPPTAGARTGNSGARYRRPSPPGNVATNARSGDASRRRRHSRSRSPLKTNEKTAVSRAADAPRANAGGKRTGAGGKRRSSSSSSSASGSSSSGTSSSSRSGSSSSAASSSSSSSAA